MDELEKIKKKKLEALQKQYQESSHSQLEEEEQAAAQVAALEQQVKTRLSKEALQRYGNIKTADPEKAIQLLVVLARLIQMGRISTVSDEELKSILVKLSEKRETKITRR
jgi:DNA-binding TFAR19-related protein (PDSD5 family)